MKEPSGGSDTLPVSRVGMDLSWVEGGHWQEPKSSRYCYLGTTLGGSGLRRQAESQRQAGSLHGVRLGWVELNEEEESSRCQRASNSKDKLSCPHAHRGMEDGWADICWKIPISPPAFEKKKKKRGKKRRCICFIICVWVSCLHGCLYIL